jgi:Diadenosine tetraphosphate (Ap4A) hydrolase and other HIT family hydrolases
MSACLFCRIVAGEIPAKVVHEDDEVLAFRDISPQAPVHILLIPKRHIASVGDATVEDAPILGTLLLVAKKIAENEGIASGYRLVTNRGAEAGQSVFHLHVHLLGGRPMGWPPG